MKKKGLIIGVIILTIIILFTCYYIYSNKVEKFKVDNIGEVLNEIDENKLNELLDNKKNFLLFAYNNYCPFKLPCGDIFEESLKELDIDAYQISFEKLMNTKIYNNVKFGPTFIILYKGRVISYLDANSDSDYNKYQDTKEFKNWLLKYIEI